MEEFGLWVRRRRRELDLTQEGLAELVPCSVDLVRKLERGERRPSREMAARLGEVLGLLPGQLADFVAAARGTAPPPAVAPPPLPPLPAPPLPLVGRAAELGELAARLADPACRLVTILGPGGVGKTRLALEAAARAEGEVAFAALEGVAGPGLLPLAIAGALGAGLAGAAPPEEQLAARLRGRRLLLVLDNMEHLREGAPLLGRLLAAAPGLRLLATSRERLGLRGEWLLELAGLPLGAPGGDGALALFLGHVARARGGPVAPAEAADAARVCRIVEGSPLALELAAAWARALSCAEIADELARTLDFLSAATPDLPPRQRSARAAFDYAWALLTPAEAALLPRLALFQGGFDRAAAEEVAGASLAALAGLLDRSLLRRGPDGRYHIHALLRQFAAERLAEAEAAGLRARHAAHFARRLAAAQADLAGPGQAAAVARLLAEVDNLRAAWGWAVAAADDGLLAMALGPLAQLHEIRGWHREGRALFGGAAAAWRGAEAVAVELAAAHGWFTMRAGDHEAARPLLAAALARARALGAPVTLARALDYLGLLELLADRPGVARPMLEESLASHEAAGNAWGAAFARGYLGLIAAGEGDLAGGLERCRAAAAAMAGLGDPRATGSCLLYLGIVEVAAGHAEAAADHLRESMTLAGRAGDRWTVAAAMAYLGAASRLLGEGEAAAYLLREAAALMGELGDRWGQARAAALAATPAPPPSPGPAAP